MLQYIPCVSRYAVAACCSVLQCVAVWCSVSHAPRGMQHVTLQGAAGCCKVLQGAAAWCSAFQGCQKAFETFHVVPNLQKSASLDENTSHQINQSRLLQHTRLFGFHLAHQILYFPTFRFSRYIPLGKEHKCCTHSFCSIFVFRRILTQMSLTHSACLRARTSTRLRWAREVPTWALHPCLMAFISWTWRGTAGVRQNGQFRTISQPGMLCPMFALQLFDVACSTS